MAPDWEIQLFGGLRIWRVHPPPAQQVEISYHSDKGAVLLAYMALKPGWHHRDELAGILGPPVRGAAGVREDPGAECRKKRDRHRIRVEFGALQAALEPTDQECGRLLVSGYHQAGLRPEAFQTDVARFEQGLRSAALARDRSRRAQLLAEAVHLYEGDLLADQRWAVTTQPTVMGAERKDLPPGYDWTWLTRARAQLKVACATALQELVSLLEAAEQPFGALYYARRAQALELDAPGLKEALDRLAPRPGSRPCGPYRQERQGTARVQAHLDVPHPGRVSAKQRQRAATGAPPLPNRLPELPRVPLQLDHCFGCEERVRELRTRRAQQKGQPVLLTGSPGVGKTRLAIEAAREPLAPFGGAIWFVPLAGLQDANSLLDAIARKLQLARTPNVPLAEQVAGFLAPRPALLILDNFEHLAPEGLAIIQSLLRQVPTLTCLVTSRHSLPGAQVIEVLPLPVPPLVGTSVALVEDDLANLFAWPSIQLFLDRARAANPRFTLGERSTRTVANLCHRLGGIPLAIELAAARVELLTPAEILTDLEARLEALAAAGVGGSDPPRSLSATLQWSYDLLGPPLQRFLTRLSVFRGGWTEEAAQAVCCWDEEGGAAGGLAEWHARDLLALLQVYSLVVAEHPDDRDPPTRRYRLLEILREYCSTCLEGSGVEHASRERHSHFFLSLAERAAPELEGGQQGIWLDRLDADWMNVNQALDWTRRNAADPGAELTFAGVLGPYWEVRGHVVEGYRRLQEALTRSTELSPARARALVRAAILAQNQNYYVEAGWLLKEAVALCRQLDLKAELALSLLLWGGLLSEVGVLRGKLARQRRAQAAWTECLALYRQAEDWRGVAQTRCVQGFLLNAQGDYAGARALFEEALAGYERLGDQYNIVKPLDGLAHAAHDHGDYGKAWACYRSCLEQCGRLQARWRATRMLEGIASLCAAFDSPERAAWLWGAAVAIRKEIGTPLPDPPVPARIRFDQGTQAVCLRLGMSRYQELARAGARSTLDEAITYALDVATPPAELSEGTQ